MEYEKIERSAKIRKHCVKAVTYTGLTLWGIMVLFPFYWMLLTSVKGYGAVIEWMRVAKMYADCVLHRLMIPQSSTPIVRCGI